MKRHIYIVLLLLITSMSGYGQHNERYGKLIAEANRYFHDEQYHLALELYNEALTYGVHTNEIDYFLAECYRHTFNYAEAEAYYHKVMTSDPADFPLVLYYYPLMLKLNGNLSEARRHFDRFIAFYGQSNVLNEWVDQAIIEKAGCEIAQTELGMSVSMEAALLPGIVNSAYNDFAPAFRDAETLVITSSRVASNRTLIDERNGEAFTDNYYFKRVTDQWEDHTRREFQITNALYHDGTGSFKRGGDSYYYTVCEAHCRIVETHLENGQWTKPTTLNEQINVPGSESKHPAISPGGDTLYFVSDRAGGSGGFDIWVSTRQVDGQWGPALNLGKTINTRADELAPTAGPDPSVLFFSSKGHPGYGGFDFFVAKAVTYDTVVYNLGLPFNSVRDDCFITFNGRNIFWSSNRIGGHGGFDIYEGRTISAAGLVARLTQQNRNDSRSVILTSRTARSENITLLASRNEERIDYNKLTYEHKVLVNRMVENRSNDRENTSAEFEELSQQEFEMLNGIAQSRYQTLLLKQKYASTLLTEVASAAGREGALSITGTLIRSDDGKPFISARVLLTNEYGDIMKMTSTNEHGRFRFTDVDDRDKLFLRLQTASAGGHRALVQNLQMRGSDKSTAPYVENVYFDFDHYAIRPEARQVLTDLAEFLKSNPGAQVEIYAFADDRGSNAYNFDLTQRRGEAVVAFLTSAGVDETSLAIIAKGKQYTRRATTEIQRQYNRRAEFYVNGVKEAASPAVKTYIAKKETYWDVIAKLTGIAEEKLRDLNGAQTEVVRAFQPIRLPLNAVSVSEELFFAGI